jgi:alpha-tubulin suppressor-like RCC1 family protein
MKNRKILLPALLSIALVFCLILPASAAGASATVHRIDNHSINHLAIDDLRLASAMALNTPAGNVTPMVAVGGGHIVGLKTDGMVIGMGDNSLGQCNVGNWTDIVQVTAGCYHTVGLKADGTVIAVGYNYYGQCDVGSWTDIALVAAGDWDTVGVKSDGTVVAVGWNDYRECDVASWTDIVQVAAGSHHTGGLKSNGRVVARGIQRLWTAQCRRLERHHPGRCR